MKFRQKDEIKAKFCIYLIKESTQGKMFEMNSQLCQTTSEVLTYSNKQEQKSQYKGLQNFFLC